ncbi:phosphatase PAP2 family protein [Bacillus massiliglaciei]|uniref:phosphatase PAP2 family protein n=1 Tax=Bacillus massiliglaciei TaxID=1816693 RepID=UPI000A696314|nr:phosphatase PAP2 family protein [Bacillus massiliglaciei]
MKGREAIAVLILTLLFILMAILQKNKISVPLETVIQDALYHKEGTVIHSIFEKVTELGSSFVIWTGCFLLVGILWISGRSYLSMAAAALTIAAGYQLNHWIKALIGRERPELNPAIDATGFSFPSGHAMMSMMFYGLIYYFFFFHRKSRFARWGAGVLIGILIGLIGISRIVLKAHYPSDVLAGFMAGVICLYMILSLYRVLLVRIKERR